MLKNPDVKEIRIDLNHGCCEVELVYGECVRKSIAGMHEVFTYVADLINYDELVVNEKTKVVFI